MARQTFRANLSSGDFPLLSDLYGRSVVISKTDMNYIRPNAFSGAEADKNIGIPQMIFAENVMPFSAGYQSVDFITPIQQNIHTDFDQLFYLVKNGARSMYVPAAGKRYIYDRSVPGWVAHAISPPAGAYPSVAVLKDRTFTFFKGDAHVYEWDGTTFVVADPGGLVSAALNGVCSGNSYLVFWDDSTIYWSSILDPLDCVPSLETGAGSEKILQNKGRIIYCKSTSDGFIIYTTVNSIYARYSGNTRFPWVYTEISGSANIKNGERSTDDALNDQIYCLTDQGLMAYGKTKAAAIFPTVAEFLGCGKLETYNQTTGIIDTVEYVGEPLVKINLVANRWIVISYGASTGAGGILMTHALIYDSAYQRWGKIKIDHVDVFEYYGDPADFTTARAFAWSDIAGAWDGQVQTWAAYGSITSTNVSLSATPYRNLAFLGMNGSVNVADFSHTDTSANSIFLIGRFQFVRDKLVTCTDVEAEGYVAQNSDTVNAKNQLTVITSFDGLNADKRTKPMLVKQKGKLSKWQMRITGVNHVLQFTGDFRFNSIQLKTMLNGER